MHVLLALNRIDEANSIVCPVYSQIHVTHFIQWNTKIPKHIIIIVPHIPCTLATTRIKKTVPCCLEQMWSIREKVNISAWSKKVGSVIDDITTVWLYRSACSW